MSLEILNYHLRLISDPIRMAAWKAAISTTVRPGDIVADIGTGVGVLALLACEAGASRVYAIEESAIIEGAREIAARSPFRDRITFFRGASSAFQPPEPMDVVTGDLLGVFGVTGGLPGAFADARCRFLKPGGSLLPTSLEMFAAPVEFPEWYRMQIDGWSEALPGFNYHRCRERVVNQMHLLKVSPGSILADPPSLGRLPLETVTDSRWQARCEMHVTREAVMHGIAGWCRCEYAPGVVVTNSPLEERRTRWHQAVLPVERAVTVQPGDVVEMDILYNNPSRWTVLTWKVRVFRGGAVRESFRHSTFNGEFLSPERIREVRASFKPPAPSRDRAARRVLDLCNGERTLAEVQSELLREFSGQFHTAAAASSFVRRLIDAAGD